MADILSAGSIQRREYSYEFPRLDGGLNLAELDCRLKNNESPEMKNMWWRNGALSCRDGQHYLAQSDDVGEGYTCYDGLYFGYAFFHIGEGLYCSLPNPNKFYLCEIYGDVPRHRGTFFKFGELLYYKTQHCYLAIEPDGDLFCVYPVPAYVPVTVINADPGSGAGDMYQPENRLGSEKTLRYNAKKDENGVPVRDYYLPVADKKTKITHIEAAMDSSLSRTELTETAAELTADPEQWDDSWDGDFAFWPDTGHILFKNAPAVTEPPVNNTVHVTYSLENKSAYDSLMTCGHAIVYGGENNACVVLGGGWHQPNTYFWSGAHTAMDPGYFPMEQYNLAGDSTEWITGFGRQQGLLVIFKENSVGKAAMSVTEINGRSYIEMPYTEINSRIGCDLPFTIAQCQNNLVFANSTGGVFFICDSSAAFENNIVPISRKIDGDLNGEGLGRELIRAGTRVFSASDGSRYWIMANNVAYVWDYSMSTERDPVWFFFTNIRAVAMFRDWEILCHLDKDGAVTQFSRQFSDYGEPIEKVFRFPAIDFGAAGRTAQVTELYLTVNAETDSIIELCYLTDTGEREEPMPVWSPRFTLCPRNLGHRYLGVPRFAGTHRRTPSERHLKNFSVRLRNAQLGADMSVISARVRYRLQGRYR